MVGCGGGGWIRADVKQCGACHTQRAAGARGGRRTGALSYLPDNPI